MSLPQPKIKKKYLLFSLLPNTVTNIMYRNTPSHNIQQKADMKKYCNSAATDLQASFVNNVHNDQQYSDIAAFVYLTVSAKSFVFACKFWPIFEV